MLTACQTTKTPTIVTTSSVSCVAFQPITYSGVSDTKETIEQIKAHNRVWNELCKDKK